MGFALAGFLALLPTASASADKGHRFVGTLHGGMATEAGAGATLELRLLDSICLGGTFDYGINFVGEHGSYSYFGPAVHGSFPIKFGEIFELRPLIGARFPFGVEAKDAPDFKVVDNSTVAFTAALRASFYIDWFVIGLQADFTPHGLVWEQLSTGGKVDSYEYMFRTSLVLGVALGEYGEGYGDSRNNRRRE